MEIDFKKKNYSFLLDILLDQRFHPKYQCVVSEAYNGAVLMELKADSEDSGQDNNIGNLTVYDVPGYVDIKLSQNSVPLELISAPLYHGFSIELDKYADFKSYLNNEFDARRRSRFRGLVRKFEHCIEPTYQMFYGPGISKSECDSFLNKLELMMRTRFHQKREVNYELPLMNFYKSVIFPLIIDKKASLFVISDGDQPINISMNFMLGQNLLLFNSAFDINYEMFGIGHINMLKHLEWAFNQGFKKVDLGRGDYIHKRRWVNHKYIYNELIAVVPVQNGRPLMARLRQISITTRFHLVRIFKVLGLHLLYGRFRRLRDRSKFSNTKLPTSRVVSQKHRAPDDPAFAVLEPLDINLTEFPRFQRPLFSFLHKNNFRKNDVEVYFDKNKEQCFYVKNDGQYYEISIS